MTVSDIITALSSTSSRNEKIAILEEHKENSALKHTLKAALDPHVAFYIRSIPNIDDVLSEEHKESIVAKGELDDDSILEQVLQMSMSSSSREEIKANMAVGGYLMNDPSILEKVLKKDLSCGVAKSIVNKVWPKHISTFDVMKAEERAHLNKIRYPALASLKLDGIRLVVTFQNGNIVIKSSSGKTVSCLEHIEQDIQELADRLPADKYYDGFTLDGELVYHEEDGTRSRREKSNGLANRAILGTLSEEEALPFKFYVFDLLRDATKLSRGIDAMPLKKRLGDLMYLEDKGSVVTVPGLIVDSEEEALEYFKVLCSEGEEGIILKNLDSIYECKRSKDWVKLKQEKEADVVITDWTEHTKKPEQLGSMTVSTSDGGVKGKIGTKLTDKQRKDLYKMAVSGDLVNKIITIRYHEVTVKKDTTVPDSFYLPRFIEIRYDKEEADSTQKVKDQE